MKHILIIEDSEEVLSMIGDIITKLPKNKYTVVTTATDALVAFKSEKFDLVITDLTLPDHSGDWILKTIRETNKDIPVYLHSSFPEGSKSYTEYSGILTKLFGLDSFLKGVL